MHPERHVDVIAISMSSDTPLTMPPGAPMSVKACNSRSEQTVQDRRGLTVGSRQTPAGASVRVTAVIR